jgi:hypothetical protein
MIAVPCPMALPNTCFGKAVVATDGDDTQRGNYQRAKVIGKFDVPDDLSAL